MKKLLYIFMAAILSASVFIAACSDDDNNNSIGSQLVEGDVDDPSYQFVTSEVGTEIYGDFGYEVDMIFALLADAAGYDLGASKVPRIGEALGADSEDSITTLIITSWQFTTTDWFVFRFQAQIREIEFNDGEWDTNLVNIYDGIDSLQLKLGTATVDSADIDLGVDGFDSRVHARIDISAPNFLANSSVNHRLELARGFDGNDSLGVVNAAINDTVTTQTTENATYCEVAISQNSTVTDLVVRLTDEQEGECPHEGSASTTASFSAFCIGSGGVSGLNLNGLWTVAAEIENGMRTITVVNGNTRWTVTEPNINCN